MKLRKGDRLGVLTSGGDAPGMNSAVRAAWKVGTALGLEVLGIEDGYRGLMEGRARALDGRTLDEASRRGGTLLGTARSKTFPTPEGQTTARKAIRSLGLRALLVVGGNGSLAGARTLLDAPAGDGTLLVAGVPASIDNDLAATSMAIGVDTALNTIVEAVDRIADTASAHRRTFIVEVMGRDCGYLAMASGVAVGADVVLVPELGRAEDSVVEQVVRTVDAAYQRDDARRRVLIVKAEGARVDAAKLKSRLDEHLARAHPDVDSRVTVLGHVVRGGAPTAFDRLLGARLANAAVRALADGRTGLMAGWVGPGVTSAPSAYDPYVALTPLDDVLAETARMMGGASELSRWRKRVFEEVEGILPG